MELIQVINESGVEQTTAAAIQAAFDGYFKQAAEWETRAKALVVTDVSQTREMKMAREARLALKNIRVEADKKRKALKEDSLRYGKAVQGVYNVLEYLIVPIENHLEQQEKFAEIQEQRRKEALFLERSLAIEPYAEYLAFLRSVPLLELSDEEFADLVFRGKQAKHEAEESARIEAARIEAERKQRELHETRKNALIPFAQFIDGFLSINFGEISDSDYTAIQSDAKGKKDAFEAEQARIKAEKVALEAKLEAERKAAAEKLKAEKEAAEKLRAEQEAKLRAEMEAKRKAESELAARLKAEEQARKAAEKAAKKAAAAPDVEKLRALALQLQNMALPEMRTDDGVAIISDVKVLLGKIANHIESKVSQL